MSGTASQPVKSDDPGATVDERRQPGLGWRARIGLLLPADNAVTEPELYALHLPGVTFHTARLDAGTADEMWADAVRGAAALGELGVDAIAYCCAETSLDAETARRAQLVGELATVAGVTSATTATAAMLAAVAELGVRRVSVVTPYRAASGESFEAVLAGAGIEVVAAVHRDFRAEGGDPREWFMTNRQALRDTCDLVRLVDRPEAEAVLVCATNLAFLSILDQVERDLGKVVICSNQSIARRCLLDAGITDPVPAAGRLLLGPS